MRVFIDGMVMFHCKREYAFDGKPFEQVEKMKLKNYNDDLFHKMSRYGYSSDEYGENMHDTRVSEVYTYPRRCEHLSRPIERQVYYKEKHPNPKESGIPANNPVHWAIEKSDLAFLKVTT